MPKSGRNSSNRKLRIHRGHHEAGGLGQAHDEVHVLYGLAGCALADVVISRAGANAICELLALPKPNLLIPLSANASRGDQILNARSFEHQGFSMVMEEEELTDEKLLAAVHKLYDSREDFINAMNQSSQQDPIKTIIGLIEDAASK